MQSKMREEIAAKDKESDRIRSQMELLIPQKMENAILPAFYNLNHNNIKSLKENAQNLYNLYLSNESMRSHGCLNKLVTPDEFE